MREIYLIGTGGHCRSCIDVIESKAEYKIVGLISENKDSAENVFGYKVVGSDSDIPNLISSRNYFLIAIGQLTNPAPRIKIFQYLNNLGANLPTIVSSTAYVSPRAHIGIGSVIMHGVVINANAEIGSNCIINSSALVEHDVIIEDNCHISTGARINGGAHIGGGSFIGSGAVVKQGVRTDNEVVIPAAKFVAKNVLPYLSKGNDA